jgi:hypothetical protein
VNELARRIPYLALCVFALLISLGVARAQEEFPPPEGNPEDEKKKKGSLQPRPEDDPKTELWVAKLGASRARPLSTPPGVLLHHVMSPDGTRCTPPGPTRRKARSPRPAPIRRPRCSWAKTGYSFALGAMT